MTTDNTNNALNKFNLKETEKINNLLVQFVFKEYFLNNDTSTFSHNNLNQKNLKIFIQILISPSKMENLLLKTSPYFHKQTI